MSVLTSIILIQTCGLTNRLLDGQVTPFFLDTPDGESVYIWHIAPLPLYLQHEDQLSSQPPGVASDITSSETFKLLKQDPEAKVIITRMYYRCIAH